jgi:hypothetical protein
MFAKRLKQTLLSDSEHSPGSYGRGIYAGHSTFGQDFSTPGSYGRGEYAGHSTHQIDFSSQGSFGHVEYRDRNTHHIKVATQGCFASRTLPISDAEASDKQIFHISDPAVEL